MSLKKLTQISPLLICSFISIFLISCGGSDKKLQNLFTPPVPGGGGSGGNGDNSSVNSIEVKNPGVDFNDIYEQVGNKSADFVFSLNSGNVKNFQVDLDSVSKQNGDWILTKSGTCAGNIYAPGSCTVTITFRPTTVVDYKTSLNYSYTNNQNKVVSNSIPIISKPIKSLLGSSLPLALPESDLASLVSANYFADTGNYVGLTSFEAGGSLIKFNASSYKKVGENVLSYGVSSFKNTVFYKSFISTPSRFRLLNLSGDFSDIKTVNISVTSSNEATYGTDGDGNIYQINSDGSSILKYNVNNYFNELISSDKADSNIIYGVFHEFQDPSNIYLCSINIAIASYQCSSTEESSLLANATNILAYKGKVFVITQKNNVLNVVGFENNPQSIIRKFKLSGTIAADNVYPPVYDPVNNVLYIVTSLNNNGGYMLTAVDTNNGLKFSLPPFNKSETISAPFLLSPTASSYDAQKKVLAVSDKGKIYAFKKDTQTALMIKPFVFNNGNTFYSLPAQATVYPLAANLSEGGIYIPYSTQNVQALYNVYTDW